MPVHDSRAAGFERKAKALMSSVPVGSPTRTEEERQRESAGQSWGAAEG